MLADNDSRYRSIEQYSRVGDAYVRSENHAKGADLECFIEIVKPEKEWLVLDVATGGGHTALVFAPHVYKVIAIDLTPNMLKTAEQFIREEKAITNVEFKQADAEDLPFDNNLFNLVTCRIAPHHFPNCHKFVKECVRVLRDNGILLVQDHVLPEDEHTARYVDDFERLRDPSHNRAFSEKEWRAMFEDSGMIIEHTSLLTKRHDFVQWGKRMNISDETYDELIRMIKTASEPVLHWLQPLPSSNEFDLPNASFVNHHIIIAGHKQTDET